MMLLFVLIIHSISYPLELCYLDKDSYCQFVRLAINVDTPYSLTMCYNEDILDEEGWKPMIEYDCDERFAEFEIDLPKEGDYNLFYSFRLTTDSYTTFCQPFYYKKKEYRVVEKDYRKELSKKKAKKNKDKKNKDSKDDADYLSVSYEESVVLTWFGFVLVGFILFCLIGIFAFNVDSAYY
jgi:hypothetical protein